MRFVVGFLAVTVCALFSMSAQQVSTAPSASIRDPQALSIIAQSLTAMGAIAAPSRMTRSQGTITYPDGTSTTLSVETIGTDRLRQDVGTNEFSFVTNNGDGFTISKGARNRLQTWIAAYKRPENLPALSLMADYQNLNLQAQYVGVENVGSNPAHHIRISALPVDKSDPELEDLMSEFHVWIDQKSLLVVKTRHFDFSPEAIQNRTPIDVYFSDYRLQDGAQVPFHLSRFIVDEKLCDITFSTISLAASVSASAFQ